MYTLFFIFVYMGLWSCDDLTLVMHIYADLGVHFVNIIRIY